MFYISNFPVAPLVSVQTCPYRLSFNGYICRQFQRSIYADA
jgi:hypothetical protein